MDPQSSPQTLNVLVVDDELPLREELRSFPWRQHQAELVGEAENGEEALELCRKLTPDLVITDITMPVMNGLELFRSIKQQFPFMQVVVLTCHSDFDYAREALKWGALEYLIKVSLLDSDMVQVLDKARQAIAREHNHQRNESDRQRWEISKWLAQYTGKGFADDRIERELSNLWHPWELKGPLTMVRLCVCAKKDDEIYVQHELQSLLNEWQSTEPLARYWVPLERMNFLLLVRDRETPSRIELTHAVRFFLVKLQSALESRLSYISEAIRFYASIGPEDGHVESLLRLVGPTRIPLSAIFYDPSGTVYDFQVNIPASSLFSSAEKEKQSTRIREAASTPDNLAYYFRHTFPEWVEQYRPDPEQLIRWLVPLRSEWLKLDDDVSETSFTIKLTQSQSWDELQALLLKELESAPVTRAKCRKEIVKAKQRISERLSEPITLTQIAEDVGLSSFYMSRLFREEVGESFNEYVTRLRMDKAVQLLKTTNLKVYEVAEQVGIPSYRYFSVLFRNRTGVSPTEFKKG